jgi:hypothetical protein
MNGSYFALGRLKRGPRQSLTFGDVVNMCEDLSAWLGVHVEPEAISEGGFLIGGGRIGGPHYKSVRLHIFDWWPIIPHDVDPIEFFRARPDTGLLLKTRPSGPFFKGNEENRWTHREVAIVLRIFQSHGIVMKKSSTPKRIRQIMEELSI